MHDRMVGRIFGDSLFFRERKWRSWHPIASLCRHQKRKGHHYMLNTPYRYPRQFLSRLSRPRNRVGLLCPFTLLIAYHKVFPLIWNRMDAAARILFVTFTILLTDHLSRALFAKNAGAWVRLVKTRLLFHLLLHPVAKVFEGSQGVSCTCLVLLVTFGEQAYGWGAGCLR